MKTEAQINAARATLQEVTKTNRNRRTVTIAMILLQALDWAISSPDGKPFEDLMQGLQQDNEN